MNRLLYTTIAIVACIGLASCGPYQLTAAERDTAELGALTYASAEGGKFISCSGQDSDGDKYVTCTTTNKKAESVELLCSYQSKGCKRK